MKRKVTELDFKRVLEPKLKSLKDITIFQLSGNNIEMFGKYVVSKHDAYYSVLRLTDDSLEKFRNSKTAATWCVLDKNNLIIQANRLLELDRLISSLEVETQILEKKAKNKYETRIITQGKLVEARVKIKQNQQEIDKYIKLAYTCQIRGYNHGTIRTSN